MSQLAFKFDELRTVQACAILMKPTVGPENYTKLLKLLYLADRRSILETGGPITGSSMVSMANGPVLSEVYDCIKGEPSGSIWDAHIARIGHYNVALLKNPGDSELSDYDVMVLQGLAEKHRRDNYSRMITIVHGLPEWRHPKPAKVATLRPTDILLAEGESPEVISAIAKQAAYHQAVDGLVRRSS